MHINDMHNMHQFDMHILNIHGMPLDPCSRYRSGYRCADRCDLYDSIYLSIYILFISGTYVCMGNIHLEKNILFF